MNMKETLNKLTADELTRLSQLCALKIKYIVAVEKINREIDTIMARAERREDDAV